MAPHRVESDMVDTYQRFGARDLLSRSVSVGRILTGQPGGGSTTTNNTTRCDVDFFTDLENKDEEFLTDTSLPCCCREGPEPSIRTDARPVNVLIQYVVARVAPWDRWASREPGGVSARLEQSDHGRQWLSAQMRIRSRHPPCEGE